MPSHDNVEENDERALERAVEKVVSFGEQVGVTPEEIVSLLDRGMSVSELLMFLESKIARVN